MSDIFHINICNALDCQLLTISTQLDPTWKKYCSKYYKYLNLFIVVIL